METYGNFVRIFFSFFLQFSLITTQIRLNYMNHHFINAVNRPIIVIVTRIIIAHIEITGQDTFKALKYVYIDCKHEFYLMVLESKFMLTPVITIPGFTEHICTVIERWVCVLFWSRAFPVLYLSVRIRFLFGGADSRPDYYLICNGWTEGVPDVDRMCSRHLPTMKAWQPMNNGCVMKACRPPPPKKKDSEVDPPGYMAPLPPPPPLRKRGRMLVHFFVGKKYLWLINLGRFPRDSPGTGLYWNLQRYSEYVCSLEKILLKWVLSFVDPLFGHTFSHSLCTQKLFHETVSVIGFWASEYSLAI